MWRISLRWAGKLLRVSIGAKVSRGCCFEFEGRGIDVDSIGNYHHSPYIAEFFNTISNIGFGEFRRTEFPLPELTRSTNSLQLDWRYSGSSKYDNRDYHYGSQGLTQA